MDQIIFLSVGVAVLSVCSETRDFKVKKPLIVFLDTQHASRHALLNTSTSVAEILGRGKKDVSF